MIETIFPRFRFPRANIRLGFPFKDDPPKRVHPNKSLVLYISRPDMSTDSSFKWPRVGEVAEVPCWEPAHRYGELRGWLYGHGDHAVGGYLEPAKWLVVQVNTHEVVQFDGVCSFPRGKVVFIGTSKEAADYLVAREPRARDFPVIGEHRTVGDAESVIVGALGAASAGDDGTAVVGYRGVATAGDRARQPAVFAVRPPQVTAELRSLGLVALPLRDINEPLSRASVARRVPARKAKSVSGIGTSSSDVIE